MSLLKILSVAALCLIQERLPYEGTIPVPTIIPRLDVTCMLKTWRIAPSLWWRSPHLSTGEINRI